MSQKGTPKGQKAKTPKWTPKDEKINQGTTKVPPKDHPKMENRYKWVKDLQLSLLSF